MFDTPQGLKRNEMTRTYTRAKRELNRACFGSTYIKIGTIQRRLAWPLRKALTLMSDLEAPCIDAFSRVSLLIFGARLVFRLTSMFLVIPFGVRTPCIIYTTK